MKKIILLLIIFSLGCDQDPIFGLKRGWIIDNISSFGEPKTGSFYAVLVSVVLGLFIMVFIFFSPLERFARLGL